MKIYNTYHRLDLDAPVVAIGNFDGVHKGHQILLGRAREIAQRLGRPLAVLTFEPHPQRLFRPDEPPDRLTPFAVKAWRLQEFGADALVSLPFDWDFASRTAAQFIQDILIGGLRAAHVVAGYDFRFGQMRKGAAADIARAGLAVTVVDKIADGQGEAYSSSRIRQHLHHGHIAAANTLLGWEWEIRGTVVKGDRRGRALGYPTANIALGETLHPLYGVYAAQVQVEDEQGWHGAAVNIGIRPMFEVPTAQVESFIFDFSRDIYGKTLRVRPVQHLRSEAKFETLDALKAQMAEDCRQAKEILQTSLRA